MNATMRKPSRIAAPLMEVADHENSWLKIYSPSVKKSPPPFAPLTFSAPLR
ncbi:MAG: hypothetical protein JWR26_485 [Pedosphaera sp.]|nr:hypothetical protein [Pedosphaera sp.]